MSPSPPSSSPSLPSTQASTKCLSFSSSAFFPAAKSPAAQTTAVPVVQQAAAALIVAQQVPYLKSRQLGWQEREHRVDLQLQQNSPFRITRYTAQTLLQAMVFVKRLKAVCPEIEEVNVTGGFARNIILPNIGLPAVLPSDLDLVIRLRGQIVPIALAQELMVMGFIKNMYMNELYTYDLELYLPSSGDAIQFPCPVDITFVVEHSKEPIPCSQINTLKIRLLEEGCVTYLTRHKGSNLLETVWDSKPTSPEQVANICRESGKKSQRFI